MSKPIYRRIAQGPLPLAKQTQNLYGRARIMIGYKEVRLVAKSWQSFHAITKENPKDRPQKHDKAMNEIFVSAQWGGPFVKAI